MARVRIEQGIVEGSEMSGVHAFLGMPYAAAPIGDRRWQPPQPPDAWEGVRDATHFGPACLQKGGASFDLRVQEQSEDCLFLNVWTSTLDSQAQHPVMVWIHGGGNLGGAGSEDAFDGAHLARQGVTVVTFNYRLGAFGFLAHKSIGANFAVLDQVAALSWVASNIAAFGGDPDNVTVMGESAGAMSIGALLGMPAAQGLFRRAILQSGGASNLVTRPRATQVAQALLAKLGLETSQLAALADVPLEALLKIQPELGREFGGILAYSPMIDGETLPQHPSAMIAQGSAANVAILAGTNRDEWRLFAMMSGGPKVDEEQLTRIFGDEARPALAVYTEARTDQSPELAWIDIMSDLVFRMPAIRLAEAQVKLGAPVWMYRFDWESPAFGGVLGAAHAMDIPFVFNTLDVGLSRTFTGDSPTRQPLADLMHASWAAFIRSGTPAIAGLPAWPPYDLDRRATMIFGDVAHVVDDPQGQVRAVWKHVLQERDNH